MTHKKLLWSLLAIIVMWSCGKDDDPAPPAPTAAPTIANFTPESGPVGTEITITGTNFSTTVASNTVKIGSATATVTAATATQLKATVPTGATTAKVTVTVGGNTATSTKDFTVTTTGGDDPTNEAPTAEDQSFEAEEDIADNVIIGELEASDSEDDTLTFALTDNPDDLFEVSAAGVLTLAEGKSLDFETTTEHALTVTVSDGTNEPVEFTVTVTVTNVIEDLYEDPASFIMTFEVAAGQELTIGTNLEYNYDYTIAWGDGTEETLTSQNPSHVYTGANTYQVAIKGVFPALRMLIAGSLSRNALMDVTQWGTNAWQSMKEAFAGCDNLEGFSATDMPNLSEVTSMQGMFFDSPNFNGAVGDWDTSNVTNMSEVFGVATSFNQLLSWDTGNVTDMSGMFALATSFNQPLNFNTENVEIFSAMFSGATSFNQDISDWNTANAVAMNAMFEQATSFNQPLAQKPGGWNTAKVENMSNMFKRATAFNQDIGNWNTGMVKDMNDMFFEADSFNQDIGDWNTENVTDMSSMFSKATSFNQDISSWDTSEVTTMNRMFSGAASFNQNLGAWAIYNVNNMQFMLSNCGMNADNYSDTLIGWGSKGLLIPEDITLGAEGLKYCGTDEETAFRRNTILVQNKGWTITGDSSDGFCLGKN
ncbi:MAG: BspA family leucine-rich repeat surface protein [Allomuricauda sp.]